MSALARSGIDHRQCAQGLGQSAAGGCFAFRHRFDLRFGGAVHPPP